MLKYIHKLIIIVYTTNQFLSFKNWYIMIKVVHWAKLRLVRLIAFVRVVGMCGLCLPRGY